MNFELMYLSLAMWILSTWTASCDLRALLPSQETISIAVPPGDNMTVSTVKHQIQQKTHPLLPNMNAFFLTFDGAILNEASLLNSYGVQKDDILNVQLLPPAISRLLQLSQEKDWKEEVAIHEYYRLLSRCGGRNVFGDFSNFYNATSNVFYRVIVRKDDEENYDFLWYEFDKAWIPEEKEEEVEAFWSEFECVFQKHYYK